MAKSKGFNKKASKGQSTAQGKYVSYPPPEGFDDEAEAEGGALRTQSDMGNLASKTRNPSRTVRELSDEARKVAAKKFIVPSPPRGSFRRTGE